MPDSNDQFTSPATPESAPAAAPEEMAPAAETPHGYLDRIKQDLVAGVKWTEAEASKVVAYIKSHLPH